ALQSVFPQAELGTFLTLSKKDKERQLKELTMIVTGIRLFNRDCGKGGEGIDDLPAILHRAIPTTTQHIDSQLQTAQDQAFRYTAILEKVMKNPLMTKELEPYMLKEALYNIRQYEIFLQTVLSDIIACARDVEMMTKQLAAHLEQLKMMVKSQTAVPTSQVFPIFIALASLWMSFQDETVLISILSNLTTNLEVFLGTHELLFPEKVIQGLLNDVTVKSDMSRIEEHMEERVHLRDFRNMEWLFPETTANFDKLLIQYRGFCGYTFAATDGLLLPGNPTIGILKYKGKYYTFNTRDAAYSFAEHPEHYINLIKEKAKKNAELIQLLELHQQFETVIPYAQETHLDKTFAPYAYPLSPVCAIQIPLGVGRALDEVWLMSPRYMTFCLPPESHESKLFLTPMFQLKGNCYPTPFTYNPAQSTKDLGNVIETGSLGRFKTSLSENILGSPKELAKLSVPSLVYAVQNNMAFLALSHLDAAVYQVTYQLKIPCTALCTVFMLNRKLSKLQWVSVFMLCGGVTLVQWKPAQATKVVVEQNPVLGFGAIAIAVLCSGFAGVYFEKVLKSSDTSLWVRNIQMYLSGIVVTLVGTYLSDGAEIQEKGFFYGYTYYVWFVIFLASVGGLYTSVVVKYTDNILKGFSAAAAIVLSTIASVILFGLQISMSCLYGAVNMEEFAPILIESHPSFVAVYSVIAAV
ncbi:hypothetical protein STEG23_016462, partial [Scotinomys teguina]